ncbi:MAG: hypothetical protein HZA51_08265 [Planctomycetes bacterium]|nr:hypothetical protein [Planctomycetota bacterium]
MSPKRLVGLLATTVTILLVTGVPFAFAGHLQAPDGNPTGPASASGPQGTSTLGPSPAIPMLAGTCPWLVPALAAQGFDDDGADNINGNADDWNIVYVNLPENALRLRQYNAWYGTQPGSPDYTCGDLNAFGPRGGANSGGATMCLTYSDQTVAPPSDHWIQVLREKPQSADGMQYGNCTIEPGYCYHIDNLNNGLPRPDPFYDTAYYASAKSFSDRPFHDIIAGYDWQFQVFPSKVSAPAADGRTLTIYDGLWWGFNTPEPGCAALLSFGLLFTRRQGRRATRNLKV